MSTPASETQKAAGKGAKTLRERLAAPPVDHYSTPSRGCIGLPSLLFISLVRALQREIWGFAFFFFFFICLGKGAKTLRERLAAPPVDHYSTPSRGCIGLLSLLFISLVRALQREIWGFAFFFFFFICLSFFSLAEQESVTVTDSWCQQIRQSLFTGRAGIGHRDRFLLCQ
jgi:hypothetical protein